jgi:NarL family two-component system sensor histidine kinase YdfH
MMKTAPFDRGDTRQYRQLWPFFLILTIFAGYGTFSAIRNQAVLGGFPLALFVALAAASTALYWFSPFITTTRARTLVFCAVQGTLGFAMGSGAPGHWLTFALFGGLVGIATAAFFFSSRFGFGAVAMCLGFLALTLTIGWRGAVHTRILTDLAVTLALVFVYVFLFIRQFQARIRAEELLSDLEKTHARLQESAAQVEALSVGRERERMAIELHDTLIQGLAGLTMQLQAIEAHLEQGDAARAQEFLRAAIQRARSTQEESRRAVAAMLPSALEQYSLEEAMRRELEQMALHTGAAVRFEADDGLTALPSEVQRQVFRIVQEGLSNSSRHAMASEVVVRMTREGADRVLEISDDGVGFDVGRRSEGLGLKGMRERAAGIGALLEVSSARGEGTTVRCRISGSEK